MEELLGTLVGRWYVTVFGATFLWRASRHIGWRNTLIYLFVSVGVGGLAENGSVHIGFPYTRYAFSDALRGQELFLGDVPLMVPLSYGFMSYFAFAAGRLIVSGLRHTRAVLWQEYLLGVIIAVWALWILDPVSRLGDRFYLGEVFQYDGPGFWFGLPVGSQLGFTLTAALLVGLLTWLSRDEPDRVVTRPSRHPHLTALITYHVQVAHIAVVAVVLGETEMGGSALLMWVPAAAITAVHWSALRRAEQAGRPDAHEMAAASPAEHPAATPVA